MKPLSTSALDAVWMGKYGAQPRLGWGPRMRRSFGYFTPDDHYEALLDRLIVPGCSWADVGCGRQLLPKNPALARTLAPRSALLLGIDPSDNIRANPWLAEAFQGTIQQYRGSRRFDVVTLRMVAEHLAEPLSAVQSIARLLRPGGVVVIYTPLASAPLSVLARLVSLDMRRWLARRLWNTDPRDIHPVSYRLNSRAALRRYFGAAGLTEQYFVLLDDCAIFPRSRLLNWMELTARAVCRAAGLRYPEACLLAVYGKPSSCP